MKILTPPYNVNTKATLVYIGLGRHTHIPVEITLLEDVKSSSIIDCFRKLVDELTYEAK